MELINYKRKFKALFEKFFQEKFELSAYLSHSLIKHLEDCSDKRVAKVIETPFFSDLLIYSLMNSDNATNSVRHFLTEVLRIMVRNELQFSKFIQAQGFEKMTVKLLTKQALDASPELQSAAIKYITDIIDHSSGILFTLQTKIWSKVITLDTSKRNQKICSACYDYIAKFVWKLDEYDEEEALTEVLTHLSEPIKNNKYTLSLILDAEGEKALYEPFLSHVYTLLRIVSNHEKIVKPNKVIPLLSGYMLIEQALSVILDVSRDPKLVGLIAELIFRLCSGLYISKYLTNNCKIDVAQEVMALYYNVVNGIMHKRMRTVTMDFAFSCFTFWTKLDENIVPVSFERNGRTYVIHDQFLMFSLTPVVMLSYKKNPSIQEYVEAFYYKMSSKASEHVVKASYTYRALLEDHHENLKKYAIENCKKLITVISRLKEHQAGYVYQSLFYIVQYHVVTDETGTLTVGDHHLSCPDDIKLMSLVLESINILLKEHKIYWYENVEIIALQNCLTNLLKQNLLPNKLLLQAMALIDLSINKFLSPDLALLMESRQGSTLNEIVDVTKTFVEHQKWEVKDSALQLLLSCTELAYIKYLPMQKLLYESKFVALVANAALCDSEPYVQVTALKCLAAASKIDSVWGTALEARPNLHNRLIILLQKHPEGIVRKEAANVLLEVYSYKKLSPEFTKYLFYIMTSAALDDLHWEVQMVALQFWRKAMCNQISNRGMIDGKFPAVTFCKERRKIIVLNDREIQNQLNRIIRDLADTGSLAVLYECLNKEYHCLVIEQAYLIAKDLFTILDYHKYGNIPEKYINARENDETRSPIEAMDTVVDLTNASQYMRQEVTDSIINTNQCELIENLYKNNPPHEDQEPMENIPLNIECKWLDPNLFLSCFRETDHLALIEEKKNWNCRPNSLDELLDEMLGDVLSEIPEECE